MAKSFQIESNPAVKAAIERERAVQELKTSQQSERRFRTENKQLTRQVQKLLRERENFDKLVEDLTKAVTPVSPYPNYSPRDYISTGSEVAAVLKLSDWQIGEVINPRETEGFGRYTFRIAERRAFTLVDKVNAWAETYRKGGFKLRTLHVFSEADLVSGNIHYELEVTNEFPVMLAVEKAAELFAEVVRRLASNFDHVVLWEMSADNHGRLTKKNQSKQGALNNFSRIAHTLANTRLAALEKSGKVEVHLGEGTKLLANVLGQKFLISHGHEVMGQMGIPYYGMSRTKSREATKRMNTNKTFNYMSIGHWHVPGVIESNILVNGSLSGTTEYDHQQGRHAAPSQVSFMVHPRHGIFGWTPWKLLP